MSEGKTWKTFGSRKSRLFFIILFIVAQLPTVCFHILLKIRVKNLTNGTESETSEDANSDLSDSLQSLEEEQEEKVGQIV